ncbi:MAG: 16S rRNA (adenine(1518)-N(6)/adenine(1519)-N(6))-dimethyltransferase RsmA [Alphaproteobacteria bacterium]|nr:16S rRNA (adenine(1518)-N(6)/adenine(1519)-N(6))-dimethyltransferase RsmA [Alphaproteobacteria bacterium]
MTDKISSLPPVSEMMRDAGLEPKKQFGQNFLFDLNLTGRIARAVPDIEHTTIIEIGPGPGGLTRALVSAGAWRVIAIEKDKTTEPILSQIESVANGRLRVIYDDALRVDMKKIAGGEFSICANLPYNVGTELLVNWLQSVAKGVPIKSMTLMFQREVAERIVAKTGEDAYGRLAVLTSLVADAKILFGVPSTAFVPRPRVESAVVQIIPNTAKIKKIENISALENLTAKLFGMRRKMIRGIMRDVDWESFGLSGTERAEDLSPEKFLELSKKLVA